MSCSYINPFKYKSIYWRFAVAVFLNTILAFTQLFYANKAHSVSLLSDAIHNLGDVLGLLLAFFAQILAHYPRHPTRYTYGYQKSTLLAAFFNAILLLFSVSFIVYEAINKLMYGGAIDELKVLFIAFLGILVNGLSALLFMHQKENNINIKAAFLHLTLDALTSFGVVLSALIIYYGGYQWLDAMTALVIGGVILVSALRLLRSSTGLLLGAVPCSIDLAMVRNYLMSTPGITSIQHLHIWALGAEKTALTAHLIMKSKRDYIDYSAVQEELNRRFNINHVTLQPVYNT